MESKQRAQGNTEEMPRDERGASLVEYALLVALIALVCVAAVTILGGETSESFDSDASSLFVD